MEIKPVLLSIVVIANIVGALVRAFFEIKNNTHTNSKIVLIFVTSLATSFIAYEVVLNYDLENWAALVGILSGLIGISLVKIVIEEVPDMVLNKIEGFLNKKNDK